MSSLAGLPDLFQRGGFTYRTVPDAIDLLPKGLQHAATVVWKCCMRFLARRELDERVTDFRMAEDTGWSQSLIQKGLHALEIDLGELGTPLIERQRAHGRRTIIPKPLAGRGTPLVAPAESPPCTPPKNPETGTTDTASSSPSGSAAREAEGPRETASAELAARAIRLLPDGATESRVWAAVAVYGAEWVSRALDRVEERNRKPGNKPVEEWGFVLQVLRHWKEEGGPPPVKVKPASAAPAPAARKVEAGPSLRFTADDVAELVSACRSGPPAIVNLARVRLRMAVADGSIAPELATTIPPELLARE